MRTVALNVVVHNEAKELARLLDLCFPYVDEVVVVHDGPCSDDSLNVAHDYEAILRVGDYAEHAAPHRRLALALTQSDWVFTCDPDEVPEERLLEDLHELVNRSGVKAYTIRKVAYIDDVFLQDVRWYSLFRVLPAVQYAMLPHATSAPLGLAGEELGEVIHTDYAIIHRKPASVFVGQQRRYRRVVERLLLRFGDIPRYKKHLEQCLVMNPEIVRICVEKGYPLDEDCRH